MTTADPNIAQELADKAYRLAYEYEQKYGSCPQCVLAAVQDVLGIGDDATFKASYALAGGGCLSSHGTCGALAGGMLAISAKYGRERENFGAGTYSTAFKVAKELQDKFVTEFGSPICAGVQTGLFGRSYNLWDRKDYQAFEEAGGHRDKCPVVAGKVALWTVQVILNAEEKARKRANS